MKRDRNLFPGIDRRTHCVRLFVSQVPAGCDLLRIRRISASNVPPRLSEIEIQVACDVTNPLLGPLGATTVYGPQKGVTSAEQHQLLESGLANLSALWRRDLASPSDIAAMPGGGAAGGLGAGLVAFCHAKLRSGVELVATQVKLADAIRGANLVITGEGKIGTTAPACLLQNCAFLDI